MTAGVAATLALMVAGALAVDHLATLARGAVRAAVFAAGLCLLPAGMLLGSGVSWGLYLAGAAGITAAAACGSILRNAGGAR